MPSEAVLRLTVFFGIFLAMALWEIAAPMRRRALGRGVRWTTNWAIAILGSVLGAVLKAGLGLAAVAAALHAETAGIGLLHMTLWPGWIEILIALVVLDFAIWFQHLASHKIPVLWQLHRVHHADRDVDVTTAIRFHPIEIALSMVFKIAVVYAVGAPMVAVVVFEIVLNGAAMFNHANIRLPQGVDRWLRLGVVTPDMHRVHHSIDRREHDANYGFNLAIWDRLFRTYVAQPRGGHTDMTLGLEGHQTAEPGALGWSLMFPFRK